MGGSSGSGGKFGNALVTIGTRLGGTAPTTPTTGAQYTPTQQGARYTPQYQQYQAPMQQAPTQQAPMQLQGMGLNDLLTNMMQQYSRPMMRAPMQQMPTQQMPVQQGIAPYSGLNYRPNMSGITANLNRVAPSVELQQRLAAEAEAKRAAEEAANKPSSQGAIPTGYDNG